MIVAKRNWSAAASYYFAYIDHLIVRTPTGNINGGIAEVTKRNVSRGFVHGVELSGNVYRGVGLARFGSLAWQEGKTDEFPRRTRDVSLTNKEAKSKGAHSQPKSLWLTQCALSALRRVATLLQFATLLNRLACHSRYFTPGAS